MDVVEQALAGPRAAGRDARLILHPRHMKAQLIQTAYGMTPLPAAIEPIAARQAWNELHVAEAL